MRFKRTTHNTTKGNIMQEKYFLLGKKLLLRDLRNTEVDLLLGNATPQDYKVAQTRLCDWIRDNEPASVREMSFV